MHFLPRFNLCRPPIVDRLCNEFARVCFSGRVSVDNRILKLRSFFLVQQIFSVPVLRAIVFCVCSFLKFFGFMYGIDFLFMAACFVFCLFSHSFDWNEYLDEKSNGAWKESNIYSLLRASRVLNETAHHERDEMRRKSISELNSSE